MKVFRDAGFEVTEVGETESLVAAIDMAVADHNLRHPELPDSSSQRHWVGERERIYIDVFSHTEFYYVDGCKFDRTELVQDKYGEYLLVYYAGNAAMAQ